MRRSISFTTHTHRLRHKEGLSNTHILRRYAQTGPDIYQLFACIQKILMYILVQLSKWLPSASFRLSPLSPNSSTSGCLSLACCGYPHHPLAAFFLHHFRFISCAIFLYLCRRVFAPCSHVLNGLSLAWSSFSHTPTHTSTHMDIDFCGCSCYIYSFSWIACPVLFPIFPFSIFHFHFPPPAASSAGSAIAFANQSAANNLYRSSLCWHLG